MSSQVANGLAQSQAPDGLAPGVNLTRNVSSRDMSHSDTLISDDHSSAKLAATPGQSILGEDIKEGAGIPLRKASDALSSLPDGRKSLLLFCFCLAMFM